MLLFLVPRLERLTQLGVDGNLIARCVRLGRVLDLPMREHLPNGEGEIVKVEIAPLQSESLTHAQPETPAHEHHEVVRSRERVDAHTEKKKEKPARTANE